MGRKLELKTVPFGDGAKTPDGKEAMLDYRAQLILVLRVPADPRGGVTYEEMKIRLPLIDKIKAAGQFVLLTDAEWREARAAFERYPFRAVIEGVYRMGQDIDAAETVKLEEVGGASAPEKPEKEN